MLNKEYFGITDWEFNENGILTPISTSTVNSISPIKDAKTEDTSYKLSYYTDTVTQITPVTNEVIKKNANIWTCLLYGQRIAYSATTGAKYTTSTSENTSAIVPAVDFTKFAVTTNIRIFNTETSFTDINVIDYINSNPTTVKPASLSSSTGIGIVIETDDDTVVYPVSNNTRFYDYGRQISGGDAFSMWFQNRVPALGTYKFYNANPVFYLETTDGKRGALIPFDIPELSDTVRIGEDRYDPNNTPFGCLEKMYTNHFTWWECSSSFGAYVPQIANTNAIIKFIKHSGLVFLDGNGDKWLSFVDKSGKATGELIRYDDPRAKDSLNYNAKSDKYDINPSGGGSESDEDYDNIGLTLNSNGQTFLKSYAVTGDELISLLSWCNSLDVPEGLNPMDYVVSVTQAPCNIPSISNGSESTIYIGRENTNVSSYLLSNQGSYSTMTIGEYHIPKFNNNFLDYEPYTHIDLYIPYCGVVSLPPALFIDTDLRVDLIYDIFTGECSGVVYRNGNYYTSVSGNFMTMQIISTENTGAIKQAVINGALGIVGGAGTAIGALATGNVIGGAIGAVGMVSSAYKATTSMNSIAPNTSGGGGGGRCNFYKPSSCILYISTPQNYTPEDFYTVHGGVVNDYRTLASGDGFTQILNPVITGNMTASEREELIQFYKTGVIL